MEHGLSSISDPFYDHIRVWHLSIGGLDANNKFLLRCRSSNEARTSLRLPQCSKQLWMELRSGAHNTRPREPTRKRKKSMILRPQFTVCTRLAEVVLPSRGTLPSARMRSFIGARGAFPRTAARPGRVQTGNKIEKYTVPKVHKSVYITEQWQFHNIQRQVVFLDWT